MTDPNSFRKEVRNWLDQNCPPSMRTPMAVEEQYWGGREAAFPSHDAEVWFDRMVEKGWTAPAWPKEYGGAGLTQQEEKILQREMRALGCRPALLSTGIWMMGPTIMQFGSEEQKRKYLPKIARGEIRWCQGYSEPSAGSDLASLSTKAVREGDHFVVNGQKVWTTDADKSDWIFCLVRTDPDASKHEGISVLLADMKSDGITARPIRLISGMSDFCETFFDDTHIPAENVLGEINKGWTIAKHMLVLERNMMSEMNDVFGDVVPDLIKACRPYLEGPDGCFIDPVFRDQITRNEMREQAIGLTTLRTIAEVKAGQIPMGAAILKYCMSENTKDRFELILAAMGRDGLGWEDPKIFSPEEIEFTQQWLLSKAHSIGGGTSEIQLNIIAKRVLGLADPV